MNNTVSNNREQWRDTDWANFLGCPVTEVAKYRKIIFENYSTCVAQSKITGKYSFKMYRYEETPSGFKRPLLLLDSKKEFETPEEAVQHANRNIISNPDFQLTDFMAKTLKVPAKVVQMLLIRQK